MINEISCSVRSKNKASRSVFLGLLGTSVILALAANFTPKYSGIVWVVALVCITATIYVYNRYVGSEYSYSVTDDGGRPTFTVSMRVGKTARTLARIDIDQIKEVRRMTGKEFRAYKCEKSVMKYPYFPTMFTQEVYLISVRSEHENADIFIEADGSFVSALESVIAEIG